MHDEARRIADSAVYIIGPGRTGSTLTGRIVQTFKDIEYAYEPSFLHGLLPLISDLDPDHFRLIYETYLYEDLFMGQVTGRTWNYNRNDESCIYNAKSEAEVSERLNQAWTKVTAVEAGKKARLAVKLTNVPEYVAVLGNMYSKNKIVITHRAANGCIESLLMKKWFSDETLRDKRIIWLSQKDGDLVVPHFVPSEHADDWVKMSELERAGLYYGVMLEASLKLKNPYVTSYDELVIAPEKTITDLAHAIGTDITDASRRLMKTMRAPRETKENWVGKLSKDLQSRIQKYSDVSEYRRLAAAK